MNLFQAKALVVLLMLAPTAQYAQPINNLVLIDEILVGSVSQGIAKEFQVPGKSNLVLKISRLDMGCQMEINPSDGNDDVKDLSLLSLDLGILMGPKNSVIPGFTVSLPITIWSGVNIVTCSCMPGKYAQFFLYERIK